MIYVVVVTGVERGAGTDSNVYIALVGTDGKLDKIRLDNDKNNFERGRIDVFHHECLDLGNLKQAIIGHDARGVGAAWFLDKIFIVHEMTNQLWMFPCMKWLNPNRCGHLDGKKFQYLDSKYGIHLHPRILS